MTRAQKQGKAPKPPKRRKKPLTGEQRFQAFRKASRKRARTGGTWDRHKKRRPPTWNPPSAAAIAAFRQLLSMTQVSFASQLGLSAQTVTFYERKLRTPNRKVTARLRELAQMNDIDLDRLDDPVYYATKRGLQVTTRKEHVA